MMLPALVVVFASGCSRDTRMEKETREQAIGFLNQGDYSAAVARFNEALTYSNGKYGEIEIDILRYRAEAEILTGDYRAAADTYELLRKVDEDKPEYMNLQVVCLVRSDGDLDEALEIFEKSSEMAPDSTAHMEALYALGSALAKSGRKDNIAKAKALYTKALEVSPTGELYNRMGTLAFEEGDIDKAIDWFDKGMGFLLQKETMDEPDVYASMEYNIAVCYEYKQEYSKAMERFKNYAQKYGTNETLEHEIAFLESRL